MFLVFEGVGGFVEVGGGEDADVAAKAHAFHAFCCFLDGEQFVARALDAVEAGVKYEGEIVGRHAVEPCAECV